MILILAETDDPFADRCEQALAGRGLETRRAGERQWMEETPFALEHDGQRFSGFLRLPGGDVPLSALTGVLVRPPRRWWPPAAFEPQDQAFVYHETTASLFALLSGLECPVANRLSVSWWLGDPEETVALRERLAARLGWPTPLRDEPAIRPRTSLYAVGGRWIGGPQADIDPVRLGGLAGALADWQRESGILFCRLDLLAAGEAEAEEGEGPVLAAVEPCPSFLDVPPDLTDQVAAAAVELFS